MLTMNKKVIHNGQVYEKGAEISEADANFKAFSEAGHISEGEQIVEEKKVWKEAQPEVKAEAQAEASDESQEKPAKSGKSARQSK